jgi:hypothetical protein
LLAALVTRILLIVLGYVVAVVGAVSVIVIAEWIRAYPPVAGDPGLVVATAAAVVIDGANLLAAIGTAALLPGAVAIAIGEIAGWRAWIVYVVFGLAVTGVLGRLLDRGLHPALPHLPAAVAAGIVGGLAYWLVAGRGAGWRRRPLPAAKPPAV